jgi:predicted RNase H-like HicB family nuclease
MATTTPRAAKDYLSLPYTILVRRDEESGEWVAQVEELHGCTARGQSPEQATRGISRVMEEWIAAALARGAEVPEPRSPATHSGRLLLRMAQTLHAELARAAEAEGVSLNQFITSALASAIGWRQGPDDGDDGQAADPSGVDRRAPKGEEARSSGPRAKLMTFALAANLVVVGIAAAVAISLLIVAWQKGW